MANPQTEKGYTKVANEILEQISKANLNGTQFRIVLVLWRYTYGYRRKEHEMSLTFISKVLETTKGHADRELTALIDRNIINVIGVGLRRGRILSFNKNYDEWSDRPISKGDLPEPQMEIVSDEDNKKPSKHIKKYSTDNSYYRMAAYFHENVSVVAMEAGVEHLIRKANLQSWADDFRKLIEIDGVDKRLAKDVMDWVTKDDFWKTNVLSAKKLREKFSELAIKMTVTKKPKYPVQQRQRDIRDKDIEFQRWVAEGNNPDEFDWGN
jgi:phage replication O-like protein O